MRARQLFVCLHHWVDSIMRKFESVELGGGHLFFVYVTVLAHIVQSLTSIECDEWYITTISLVVT